MPIINPIFPEEEELEELLKEGEGEGKGEGIEKFNNNPFA